MSFFKNFYNWYLIVLTALVTLPILAPFLLYIGLETPAKYIYFVYSFFCHQFDHRSIHVYDYQYAWCARDTAIWFGVWAVALYTKFSDIKPIKLYWLLPFVVPIALDGGIQTVYTILDINPAGVNAGDPLYISNNFSRFVTGAIFGIGLSLWTSPTFKEVLPQVTKLKLPNKQVFITFSILIALIIGYIFSIQAWSLTSNDYKPKGTLDAVVRTPSRDFFTRRAHAICPTDGDVENNYQNPADNLLALDCFF